MTGARLKEILEDVADNLFNPDPYYQQGGDMVRCGGLGYTIDIGKPVGSRISGTTHALNPASRSGRAVSTGRGLGERERGTEGSPVTGTRGALCAAEGREDRAANGSERSSRQLARKGPFVLARAVPDCFVAALAANDDKKPALSIVARRSGMIDCDDFAHLGAQLELPT